MGAASSLNFCRICKVRPLVGVVVNARRDMPMVVQTTNVNDAGNSKLDISLLLLGRPHLTHSIKAAAYNLPSKMATVHIEARENKEDLSNFIRQGISQRLQLEGASDDLMHHVQITIEEKAQGTFLWANLMLEILKYQTTEDDVRHSLRTAPEGIDGMVTEMLKVYSSIFEGREAEEFNTILSWLSCAARPLTLAEIGAALRRLSPSGSRVLSLEKTFRDTCSSLISLVRDDGLSTDSMQSHPTAASLVSIPETTKVVFAHASISEYFAKGIGRFAKLKTVAPVGVSQPESSYHVLKTCLQVFVDPGTGGWLESSLALRSYAKTSWLVHMQYLNAQRSNGDANPSSRPALTSSPDHAVIIRLLYDFLNNDNVVVRWCHDIPWEFFSERKAILISSCIEAWTRAVYEELPPPILAWTLQVLEKPQIVFLPVARVNAVESLHGEWHPLESLSVVAQVRALVESDDTLEDLPIPGKLPAEVILKAVNWIPIEPSAAWHRNVAICYRRSGHINKAIEHFKRALELDPELVEARGGLAIAYAEQGYYTKGVDLELTNVDILEKRIELAKSRDINDTTARQELSVSYETVASSYYMVKDLAQALKYWRKALATGCLRDRTIWDYFTALADVPDDSKWEEVMQVLRVLHSSSDAAGQNRLTKYIRRNEWPYENPPEFFCMAATASRETGCLPFLVAAYENAIIEAATVSNKSVLLLQVALFNLYTDFQRDFAKAEPLLEAVLEVASVEHDPRIQELEDCKEELAQDYCHICIRKALEAIERNQDGSRYAYRIAKLLKSGILPYDLAEKIVFREKTRLYLALVQRLTGSLQGAVTSLRPYMERCCSMMTESSVRKMSGMRYLAVSLLALGQVDDFLPLSSFVFTSRFGWICDSCGKRAARLEKVAICQHCLTFFCHVCLAKTTVEQTRFCIPGHGLLHIQPDKYLDAANGILFQGQYRSEQECIAIIKADWGLSSEIPH